MSSCNLRVKLRKVTAIVTELGSWAVTSDVMGSYELTPKASANHFHCVIWPSSLSLNTNVCVQ